MTEIITLKQASLEHMNRQPMGLRYALFCEEVLAGNTSVDCISRSRMGHLGDYENYRDARDNALSHPHPALIRFYPTYELGTPSGDFIADLKNAVSQMENEIPG